MLWLTENQCSRSSNDVRFRPEADIHRKMPTYRGAPALLSFTSATAYNLPALVPINVKVASAARSNTRASDTAQPGMATAS